MKFKDMKINEAQITNNFILTITDGVDTTAARSRSALAGLLTTLVNDLNDGRTLLWPNGKLTDNFKNEIGYIKIK